MVMPVGGDKDTLPPQFVSSVELFRDNTKQLKSISLSFDERIQDHQFLSNFYISPPLKNISHKIKKNILEIYFENDLQENIEYTLSLNNCIKDITEGNMIKNFTYNVKTYDTLKLNIKTYTFNGVLKNSYSHKTEDNHWVMMFKSDKPDSVLFNTIPSYVCKSNEEGFFSFNNIIGGNYKIVSISGEDYLYHEDEVISFSNEIIIAGVDSLIELFTFNPTYKIDSTEIVKDTTITQGGSLTLSSDFMGNIIVQLINGNKVVLQEVFENSPDFRLKNIATGEYVLRAFRDENKNGYWDTGNFTEKKQAEKMHYFPEKITIRENWDIELDWITKE